MIELRVLTDDDWALWRELRLYALTEAPYAFGARLSDWQGDGDREERWRARLAVPGSYNLVASVDGKAAGMASGVLTDQAETVELISMYVAPHGRGCGVGDLLVQRVEQWARQVGAAELRLAVAEGNRNAWTLYERNGFHETNEQGNLMPDGLRREHIMAKRLASQRSTPVE